MRDEFNEPKKSVIGCIDATVPSSNRVVKDLVISREVAQDCEISFANYLYLILKINGQSSPNRPTTMARRQSPRQRVQQHARAPSPQTLSPTKVWCGLQQPLLKLRPFWCGLQQPLLKLRPKCLQRPSLHQPAFFAGQRPNRASRIF